MNFTIKQARDFCGYSQKYMADKLGICEDTYRKIERDPDSATIRQAKIISLETGISYDTIFFGVNSSLNRANERETA